ncbi:MAG: RagB/SusD family nutrient uptake outer membrane protein [Niabella sp.]|nr:RagB/SusD family nutrient uptake outer membrane protein [Niabella sp.]
MRYIIYKLLIVLVVLLSLGSCKKSFLDQSPNIALTIDKAITSEASMLEAVAGMYRSMTTYYTFGRNYSVFGDLLSDNVYLSSTNSSRFLSQSGFLWTGESPEASALWQNTYFSILQANRILASNLQRTENVNYLLGECYTARALCYFYLVNWFAQPFTVSATAPGVPLVIIPANITGPLVLPARNTVAEVYTQMVKDLDSAASLMPADPKMHPNTTNFFSKAAAKALQARCYLFMGDYAKARDAALGLVQNGGFTLAGDKNTFNSYWAATAGRTDKLESIFGLNNPAAANNGVEGIDYIYSSKGFGDLLATDSLYQLYSPTDYRRGLIADSVRNKNQAYVVKKYQNATNTDRDEVKLLRYAEVLLTLAESYARTNDKDNALLYLNSLAKKRDPSFAGYDAGMTLADITTAILKERQKELAFEGLRFFDLARTNVSYARENMGTKAYSNYPQVLQTDFRRIQPIPRNELNVNPNIAPNPGY